MMIAFTTSLVLVLGRFAAVQSTEYGADCSFPIHSKEWRCGDLLGDRRKFYDDFMNGCRATYGAGQYSRCDYVEEERIAMNLRQPQSMVNYTSTGYKKIKAPQAVFDLLSAHWEANKDNIRAETWPKGNVYTNHWVSPTYMVSVEDHTLRGAGSHLKGEIWDAAKSTIEEWTGMEQKPTSMYGIRVYTEGAVLNPHVDRTPLVSSCIVNVAQDVDEPWPLEVYDREGKAVNVTMEPGDMVLYESGSLIHGRPFPLKGRYYANIFIHFEPTGRKMDGSNDDEIDTFESFYPPYLLPNSPEIPEWENRNPHGWSKPSPSAPVHQMHSPEVHVAAATGDLEKVRKLVEIYPNESKRKDLNGWQPIHEAARGGFVHILKYLIVDKGVDKDVRSGLREEGDSPLNIALTFLGKDHEAVRYLEDIGASNLSGFQVEL